MTRRLVSKEVLLPILVFMAVLAMVCVASVMPAGAPASAVTDPPVPTILNGTFDSEHPVSPVSIANDVQVTDSLTITGTVLPTMDSSRTLTVNSGAVMTLVNITNTDFENFQAKIVVNGTLIIRACTWISDSLSITVNSGWLLIEGSLLQDTGASDNPPVVINGGILQLRQYGDQNPRIGATGNYVLVMNSGLFDNVDSDDIIPFILKRFITAAEAASNYESYKKVVFVKEGLSFKNSGISVSCPDSDIYLTGNIDTEHGNATIQEIASGYTQQQYDAIRIDNGKSILFNLPVPEVALTMANNDGEEGTDGVKTYNGQDLVITAAVKNGETDATYSYKWYKKVEGDFAALSGETESTLHLRNVDDSGEYQCEIYNGTTLVDTSDSVTVSISALTANLVWSNLAFPYNGSIQNPTATVDNLVAGDICTVTVTGGASDAGEYTATATALSNANYALPTSGLTQDFTIGQTEISQFEIAATYYYNGNYQDITAICKDIPAGVVYTVELSGDTRIRDAGPYSVSVVGISNENFTIAAGAERTIAFTVLPREIKYTISATENYSVYGDPIKANGDLIGRVTSELKEAVPGEAGITLSVDPTLVQGSAVGRYPIYGDWNNDNYCVTFEIAAYQIKPRTVSLSFGAHTGMQFSGEEQNIAVSVLNLYGEDLIDFNFETEDDVTYDNGSLFFLHAGNYSVTFLSVKYNESDEYYENYELAAPVHFGFTVAPKTVGISFAGTSGLVYNAEEQPVAVSFTGTAAGFSAAPTVSRTRDGEAADSVFEAGRYNLTVTGICQDGENYALPAAGLSVSFDVAQAVVGIEFINDTGLVYNGCPQTVTAKATSVFKDDSDSVSPYLEGNVRTAAGTYTAVVKGLIGNSNYKLPEASLTKTFTIAKAPVTVTVDDKNSVYGDDLLPLTYSLCGDIFASDDLGITLSKAGGLSVGDYVITASWNNHPNYLVTINEGTYTIGKRILQFEINDAESYYGDAPAPISGIVVDGSIAEGFDPDIRLSATVTSGSPIGEYPISASYTNTNYEITFINAETAQYTVTVRPVTLLIRALTSVYGDMPDAETAAAAIGYDPTVGSVVNGDDLGITFSIQDYCGAVGGYTVTATACNANYDVVFENNGDTLYTVTPRPLTFAVAKASKVYGESDPAFSGSIVAGTLAYEETLADLDIRLESSQNAGVHDIVCSYNNPNYGIIFTGAEKAYTVAKRPIGIAFSDYENLVYNGAAHTIGVEAVGAVGCDEIIFAVEGNGKIDAGNYALLVKGFAENCEDSVNYTLSSGASLVLNYSIAQKVVGIDFDGIADKTYDGEALAFRVLPTAGQTTGDVTLNYSLKVFRNGAYVAANEILRAGHYKIEVLTIGGEDGTNYALPVDGRQCEVVVSPRAVTFQIADAQSVYGDALQPLTGAIVSGSVCGEDNLGIVYTIENYTGHAGGYTICGAATNPDYEVTVNTAIYTVAKRAADFAFSGAQEGTQNRVYKKSEFSIEIEPVNILPGDDVRYDIATLEFKRGTVDFNITGSFSYHITVEDFAGEYTLVINDITGADIADYAFAGAELRYTIDAKEVTLILEGGTDFVYDGTQKTVHVTAGNLNAGDTANLVYEGEQATDAGNHFVTVTDIDNENYVLPATVMLGYSISQATPVIEVADRIELVYDPQNGYSIPATVSSGEPLEFYLVQGTTETKITNTFGAGVGVFTVAITTAKLAPAQQNANYLRATKVIMVNVLESGFRNSLPDVESHLYLAGGADPSSTFVNKLAKDQVTAVGNYQPIYRNQFVGYVYEAALYNGSALVSRTGEATLTVALPASYGGRTEVSVMFLENGVYVQKTVPVVDGTITFTMKELANFALLDDKDMTPRVFDDAKYTLALAILGVIAAVVLTLVIVSFLVVKRKYSLIVIEGGNTVTSEVRYGDDLLAGEYYYYTDAAHKKPYTKGKMPAKDITLYGARKYFDNSEAED